MTDARKGPIESHPWPTELEAFAVDTSAAARLHGYDVESDLARHYRFSDVVYLGLVGELPDEARSRAFEIALTFLVPMSVAEGPIHAAALAGFFGSTPTGVLTAASATLSDYAADAIEASGAAMNGVALPEAFQATSEMERASIGRLRALLEGLIEVELLAGNPRRDVAILAVLRACGLKTPLQLAAAVTLARLPAAVAEAAPRSSGSFVQKYPLTTPPFVYEE
jgi:predicted small lipoprotein YifL